MRLIDADALKYTRVRIFHGMNSDGTPLVGGFNAVVMSSVIKDAPTIEAEPVVRCGECARRYTELCALYAGQMNGKSYFIQQGDDFFCKKGQRWEVDNG